MVPVNARGTVLEPAAELPVADEADVLVIGGGSAGWAAALAAARRGADTLLVERYGYVGGMATGGLVLVLDDWSDGSRKTVAGIMQEMVDRLLAVGAAVETPDEACYSRDEALWWRWAHWGFEDHYSPSRPKPLTYAVSFDAEQFKIVGNALLEEAGVRVRYHSWFSRALCQDSQIVGAVVESKEGRQALLGRVVVDATGDGDVFASAGAAHEVGQYIVSLAHRLGGVDVERCLTWQRAHPQRAAEVNGAIRRLMGGAWDLWWLRTTIPGIVWVNAPHMLGLDATKVADLTRAEVEGRKLIAGYLGYAREHLPGFEKAELIEVSPQLGVRQSRLLRGRYVVTRDDILSGREFEDSVARGRNYTTPYRALLPREIEGLLVAGRCYSATPEAQRMSREIAPCVAMGEAAGAAAALAARGGIAPSLVAVARLRADLAEHGALV